MDKEQLPKLKFSFPGDVGKEPLVSFAVKCDDKDRKQLEQAAAFRKGGSRIGTVLAAALCGLILLNIILAAFTSGEYKAAAAYIVFALLLIGAYITPKITLRRFTSLAPNDSPYFVYSFYRHHFTLISDYEGLSLSYDDLSGAAENSLGFILFKNDGVAYVIPKKELDKNGLKMLHAVLENKLGSKFDVKFL